MKKLILIYFFFLNTILLQATGQGENLDEMMTKEFLPQAFSEIVIEGQIAFDIKKGDSFNVKVTANPALMDQVTVDNWFGVLWVKINSGQLGPREKGEVDVIITMPSIKKISIQDQSYGKLKWESNLPLELSLKGNSRLNANLDCPELIISPSWNSISELSGNTSILNLTTRSGSKTLADELNIKEARITAWEGVQIQLKSPQIISGSLRGKSALIWKKNPANSGPDISNLEVEALSLAELKP